MADIFHREETYRRKPTIQISDPTYGDLSNRTREVKTEIRNIVKYLSLENKERVRNYAHGLLDTQKQQNF